MNIYLKHTKLVPMPAGQIMAMISKMAKDQNLQQPITFEDLLRAKDRYISIASKLN